MMVLRLVPPFIYNRIQRNLGRRSERKERESLLVFNLFPMAASNGLKVLKKFSVFPSSGCVPEATFPLTFFDVLWIHAHPVERIFFYPLPQHYSTTDFINSVLPSLTSSLSQTLHHFYPLAGKLRHSLNSTTDFEIHYKHGDSVSLTFAESHADFQLLSSNQSQPFNQVYTLVPLLDKFSDDSKPLLSLQVTFFPNSGISIGVALHHAACDGPSFMHFFKSWALACRSQGSVPLLHPPPIFDRSLVSDPHGCHSIFLQDLFSFPAEEAPGSSKLAVWDDAVCATFPLSLDHIQRLKKIFSTKSGENKTLPSSFAVACAYAWVCLVKTRGYSIKERAYFLFAVDCRGKLKPPVPAAFFGNCIGPGFVEEDIERLIGEDGFLVACEAIGRTIEACKGDVLRDAQAWIKKTNSLVATGKLLTTAGSPKFGVYDIDFGWGRPSKVQVTSIQKTGALCLAEGKEGQGIEIGFVLTKPIMDEFSSVFYNGLELLHSA